MYKNYVFDIYGTLIDIHTDESQKTLWEKLATFYTYKGAHYTGNALQLAYQQKITEARSQFTHTPFPDFPLEPIFESLYRDKHITVSSETVQNTMHFFRLLSTEYIKLYDGVIGLLDTLKAKKKKLYVLSNAQHTFTYYEMQFLGILDYFDAILFSADYNVCKPDAQFYQLLFDQLHLKKSETLMIGNDFICDIEGAQAVGLDTLYIHSNLSPEPTEPFSSTYAITSADFAQIIPLCIK